MKHGRKPIKWEGLANGASKDIVVMCWDSHSTATELLARGYTTITCPWGLEVPWDQWSMYVCNGSRLKRGDKVIGATLVAWEQPPETHLAGVRAVGARQERTWGPDNTLSESGFAIRSRAADALAEKLIGRAPKTIVKAQFDDPAGHAGFQLPTFALDGQEESFYLASRSLKASEHFTITLEKPQLIHSIEVKSGQNKHGAFKGQLQISTDGAFHTVAELANGQAIASPGTDPIKAIRLLASSDQAEPLILREVKLQLMTELAGKVSDPTSRIGAGNVALIKQDAIFGPSFADSDRPVIIQGATLRFDSGGGNPLTYSGPLMGTGKIEFVMGSRNGGHLDAATTLSGKAANTFDGTYVVKQGVLRLQKEDGIDAVAGKIIVGGQGNNDALYWGSNNQIKDAAEVTLLYSPANGASLNLNGFSDSFASLNLAPHCHVLTDGEKTGGVLSVKSLTIDGKTLPPGIYTNTVAWVRGSGFVAVGSLKWVDISGDIADPRNVIGEQNIAVLKTSANLSISGEAIQIPVKLNGQTLTLSAQGCKPAAYAGFITGEGTVVIRAAKGPECAPFELNGSNSNVYAGPTHLAAGVLKLDKPRGAIAIPGDLFLGGSEPLNNGEAVVWAADGQINEKGSITIVGTQPSFLDLSGHQAAAHVLTLSRVAKIKTGDGGRLKVKQLIRDGKKLATGAYDSKESWITGSGSVVVDPRIDVQDVHGNPNSQIGIGNIANLTGDMEIRYPASDCSVDIINNGFTVTYDSGNGNPSPAVQPFPAPAT